MPRKVFEVPQGVQFLGEGICIKTGAGVESKEGAKEQMFLLGAGCTICTLWTCCTLVGEEGVLRGSSLKARRLTEGHFDLPMGS